MRSSRLDAAGPCRPYEARESLRLRRQHFEATASFVPRRVAADDILQRPEELLERLAIEAQKFALCFGDHARCARFVVEQGQLAKVVPAVVMQNLLRRFSWLEDFRCGAFPSLKDIELLS